MEKMKAWIFEESKDENGKITGSTHLEEIDKPVCGDKQALLKINVACICGGDKDCISHGGENHRVYPGREWGHEMSATVVEMGKDTGDCGIKVGDRVWPFPMFCTNPYGQKSGALGGFSEYIVVDEPKKDFNLFLLDGITDIEGAMIEPFTIGWHAGCQTHPGAGKNAVIFGVGCIGLSAALACAWFGCDNVVVVGRRADKLALIKELGFKTFSILDEDWETQLREYLGAGRTFSGRGINAACWVEATANADAVDEIVPLMNFGARMAIVSAHEKPVTFNAVNLAFAELEIVGSAGQRHKDAFEVIEMLKSKRWDIEKACGYIGRQEDLLEGIEMMRQGKVNKACLDYTGKYVK